MKHRLYETQAHRERALLIGIHHPQLSQFPAEDCLEELALLADTAGLEVAGSIIQNIRHIDPGLFIGRGKVAEIASMVKEKNIQVVIFDEDLSPAQTKNIEQAVQSRIIDRSALILMIFARRARTREARTQVELAQLEYLLPRLTRIWTHLERQAGGSVFTKGPGETQLETDRRLIGRRIAVLKKELMKIAQQRQTQRKSRLNVFHVALAGYTNTGKSTLLNALADSNAYVEDRLFATLDATTRRLYLNDRHSCLITDTVGFIRKLPHPLIASFRSTLDEVRDADLILHVVDASNHLFDEQMQTVYQVLNELSVDQKNILIVFNKIDALQDESRMETLSRQYPDAVFISARRQIGLQKLKARILHYIESDYREYTVRVPREQSEVIATLGHLGEVLEVIHDNDGLHIRYRSRRNAETEIEHYLQKMKIIAQLKSEPASVE